MTERRCPHGFLRSRVTCQECGPVRPFRQRPARRARPATWLPKAAPHELSASCRFCRQGYHPSHANFCDAYRRHRNREARLERRRELREALSRVA